MKTLSSFLGGEWKQGSGSPAQLKNPSTEEVVAQCSTQGLDFGAAVRFARERGGPALRAMTFAGRAAVLARLARAVNDARDELIGLCIVNAGTTRSDAKFDIDGASATLNF